MNITNDFCLAKANSTKIWECTARKFDLIKADDGLDGFWWSFSVTEVGLYALIINPDKDVVPPGPTPEPRPCVGSDCPCVGSGCPCVGSGCPTPTPTPTPVPVPGSRSFLQKYWMWFVVAGAALVVAIMVLLFIYCKGYCPCLGMLFCCCKPKQKDPLRSLPPVTSSKRAVDQESLLNRQQFNDNSEEANNLYAIRNEVMATSSDGGLLRKSQVDREKEEEARLAQEKFDSLMKLKAEEIEKLKQQLDSLKEEHTNR